MTRSHQILDHVKSITEQRDHDLLAGSLLKSVNDMLSAYRSMHVVLSSDQKPQSVIELHNGRWTYTTKDVCLEPFVQGLLNDMIQSSSGEATAQSADGSHLVARRIFESEHSLQFLVLYKSDQFDPQELHILLGIVSVYANFLSLLNESQTDELTGLANRKTFDTTIKAAFAHQICEQPPARVEHEQRKSQNKGELPLWLAMIDIDHFKTINDRFGHIYGDEMLIHLAKVLRDSFRHEDFKFRFGGEEFVVLLRAQSRGACGMILERFRRQISEFNFPGDTRLTVSIGAVELKPSVFHITSLDYADQALYHSKGNR